jgi:hemerythrin-like domain-containing protein
VTGSAAAPGAMAKVALSPVEDLLQEHGLLNRVLVIYDEAIRRLEAGLELPPDSLRAAAKIVREYVEDYHEKLEEDYLFPRFVNANRNPDLVQVLLEQHVGGRNLTDETLHLARLEKMRSAEDRRRLANTLRRFARMYHAHESREDTVLIPTFRTLVSAQEYAALREDFDKRERELFGGESFPRFAERAAVIEAELGIAALGSYTDGL